MSWTTLSFDEMSQLRNFSKNHNRISLCCSCLVIQSVCYFHSKLDHRLLSAEETSIVQLRIDRQLPLRSTQRHRRVVAVLCVLIIGYLRAFDWTVVLPYRMEIETDSALMRTIQMSVEKLCHSSQLLEVQVTSRWWWNQLLRLKRPKFFSIPTAYPYDTRRISLCLYKCNKTFTTACLLPHFPPRFLPTLWRLVVAAIKPGHWLESSP